MTFFSINFGLEDKNFDDSVKNDTNYAANKKNAIIKDRINTTKGGWRSMKPPTG